MINLKTTENSIKLLTAGKFCNDDINVTFEGGSIEGVTEDNTQITITTDKQLRVNSNSNIGLTKTNEVSLLPSAITTLKIPYAGAVVNATNLEPQNIVKDVNILGVVGTYEGGSGSEQELVPFLEYYNECLENVNLGYLKDRVYESDEAITLYTPAQDCKYYYITKRNDSEYRIFWTKYATVSTNYDCTSFFASKNAVCDITFANGVVDFLEILEKNSNIKEIKTRAKYNSKYTNLAPIFTEDTFAINEIYHCSCGSIEECITAIKNNATIYKTASSNSSHMGVDRYENSSSVIYTNGYEMNGGNTSINDIAKQLSSNEKIEVIE